MAISPQLVNIFNLFHGEFTQKSTKTTEMKCQWMFAELCFSKYPDAETVPPVKVRTQKPLSQLKKIIKKRFT